MKRDGTEKNIRLTYGKKHRKTASGDHRITKRTKFLFTNKHVTCRSVPSTNSHTALFGRRF